MILAASSASHISYCRANRITEIYLSILPICPVLRLGVFTHTGDFHPPVLGVFTQIHPIALTLTSTGLPFPHHGYSHRTRGQCRCRRPTIAPTIATKCPQTTHHTRRRGIHSPAPYGLPYDRNGSLRPPWNKARSLVSLEECPVKCPPTRQHTLAGKSGPRGVVHQKYPGRRCGCWQSQAGGLARK